MTARNAHMMIAAHSMHAGRWPEMAAAITVDEVAQRLKASHVISFENEGQWAGYSPSNGMYWVAGTSFRTAEAAAYDMSLYPGEWKEIDQCIDEDKEVA